MVFAIGCGGGGVGPIEGESLIHDRASCFGIPDCVESQIFRKGDLLDLVVTRVRPQEIVAHSEATLTPAGVQAFVDLAAEFGPERAGDLRTCNAGDGDDLGVTLERSGTAYTLFYCVAPETFPELAPLTDFAFSFVDAFARCGTSDLFDLGFCELPSIDQ
ncbi:MAG: hypothetical protein ABI867_00605 [Kofleriaceae bacterium]